MLMKPALIHDLTCIVHENLSLAEDTEKEQINREIHAKIPDGESEVLKKESRARGQTVLGDVIYLFSIVRSGL